MKRRILYYYGIIQRDACELTRKIVLAQGENPTPVDFVSQVTDNLEHLNMSRDLMLYSLESLRKLLKERIENAAFTYLISLASQHSKVRSELFTNMHGSSFYFDQRFTTQICNTLFMFRCRMYEVKGNFRNKYVSSDLSCPLNGCSEVDSQAHLFNCSAIVREFPSLQGASYEDIFSNDSDKLLKIGNILLKIIQIREKLIEEL